MSSPLPPVPGPQVSDRSGVLTPPWQSWFSQVYTYLTAGVSGGGAGFIPGNRAVLTTAPLAGGGTLTSDLTISLAANGITNAFLAQAPSYTLKGNLTGVAANVTDFTALNNFPVGNVTPSTGAFTSLTSLYVNVTGTGLPTTGLYSSTANRLDFSTASTNRGYVDADGEWLLHAPSPNAPTLTIECQTNGANAWQIKDGTSIGYMNLATSSAQIGLATAGILNLTTGGSNRFVIGSQGDCTVNQALSGNTLTVKVTTGVYSAVTAGGGSAAGVVLAGNNVASDGTKGLLLKHDSTGASIRTASADGLFIGTNGADALVIESATQAVQVSKYLKANNYTVGTLPAASVGKGSRAFVTDALAPVFGSTVAAGGTVAVPVYSDGTNWKVG